MREGEDIIDRDNGINNCQCHSLPCNIDFDGKAPVEVYFMPEMIVDKNNGEGRKDDIKKEEKEDSTTSNNVYASQFRGRQLLALEPYKHYQNNNNNNDQKKTNNSDNNNNNNNNNSNINNNKIRIPMQGRLLEIDNCKSKTSEGKVQVVDKFDSIYEWKHEYEPSVLLREQIHNTASVASAAENKSRVLAAFEWCDVAHAVHDPIPIGS